MRCALSQEDVQDGGGEEILVAELEYEVELCHCLAQLEAGHPLEQHKKS